MLKARYLITDTDAWPKHYRHAASVYLQPRQRIKKVALDVLSNPMWFLVSES